jgi:hypothetical protein
VLPLTANVAAQTRRLVLFCAVRLNEQISVALQTR